MADAKITQLNELTAPVAADLLVIVDDPSGSPETKKITYGNVSKLLINTTPKTSNYTLTVNDRVILVDATSGDISIFVPAASGNQGIPWTVCKVDSSSNKVIIDPDSSETIDGASTYKLVNQNEAVTFTSDGTNIKVLSNKT